MGFRFENPFFLHQSVHKKGQPFQTDLQFINDIT